jgi:hypothetical protein
MIPFESGDPSGRSSSVMDFCVLPTFACPWVAEFASAAAFDDASSELKDRAD